MRISTLPLIPAQARTQMDGVQPVAWATQMTWLGPRLRGDKRVWVNFKA